MRTAAATELKASLSEYLSSVKGGEEILVTERGKPIAKIIPLNRDATTLSAHLLEMERAGLVRIGEGMIPKDFLDLLRPKDKKGNALVTLLLERETGR